MVRRSDSLLVAQLDEIGTVLLSGAIARLTEEESDNLDRRLENILTELLEQDEGACAG